MKRLIVALCVAVAGVALCDPEPVKDECSWHWFWEKCDKDIYGCGIGLGVGGNTVRGAEISLCASKAKNVKSGCQFAFGYNRADTFRNGVQIAFWNDADHAALQLGLLNFNKGGFLPFFPFFNFDKTQFGAKK